MKPTVYFTREITPEKVVELYHRLGVGLPGKRLIPFATSGGSGIEKAAQSLRAHCPAANWGEGRLLNGVDAAAWARQAVR